MLKDEEGKVVTTRQHSTMVKAKKDCGFNYCQTFLVRLMNLSIIYLSSELIVIYTQTVNRPGVL